MNERQDDETEKPESTETPEEVVEKALERMKTGVLEKEKEDKKLPVGIILFLACLFTFVLIFLTNDFRYQAPGFERDAEGRLEVLLKQNREGHYLAKGLINGESASFMLDTGATNVSVPDRLHEHFGMVKGSPIWLETANGRVQGYKSRIKQISVGGIEKQNVRATIVPSMYSDQILLGMSFLKDLTLLQEGKVLKIRENTSP